MTNYANKYLWILTDDGELGPIERLEMWRFGAADRLEAIRRDILPLASQLGTNANGVHRYFTGLVSKLDQLIRGAVLDRPAEELPGWLRRFGFELAMLSDRFVDARKRARKRAVVGISHLEGAHRELAELLTEAIAHANSLDGLGGGGE